MSDLFSLSGLNVDTVRPSRWEPVHVPAGDVRYRALWLHPQEAADLYEDLRVNTPWRQDSIAMYGTQKKLPRLQQWYGDSGLEYRWSGITLVPTPWTVRLRELNGRVERECGARFNTVLLNFYRDGNDSVGWHADDERELGQDPVIASLSLGAERDFQLKGKHELDGAKREPLTVKLGNGSLLVMAGATQRNYVHQLPKRKDLPAGRLNLTFRWVGLKPEP